jgi:hypothetical protein
MYIGYNVIISQISCTNEKEIRDIITVNVVYLKFVSVAPYFVIALETYLSFRPIELILCTVEFRYCTAESPLRHGHALPLTGLLTRTRYQF